MLSHLKTKNILAFLLVTLLVLSTVCQLARAKKLPVKNAEVGRFEDDGDDDSHWDSTTDEATVRTGKAKRAQADFDARNMTPTQILQHFGLGHVVPDLVDLLDHADNMFTRVTQDKHFFAVNRVLDAFKESFIKTVDYFRQGSQHLPPTLDEHMVQQFFAYQEDQFRQTLQRDAKVDSDLVKSFVDQYVHVLYEHLAQGYQTLDGLGIRLSWTMLFAVTPFIQGLPTEIIDPDMFRDVIEAPGQLKQVLYDLLATVVSSGYSHFLQMFAAFLSTVNFKKFLHGKEEL